MNDFTTALEARRIIDELYKQSRKLNYNPQYKIILNNLDKMVNDLSNAEVRARQSKKSGLTEKHIVELKKAITYFEQLLLIQALSE